MELLFVAPVDACQVSGNVDASHAPLEPRACDMDDLFGSDSKQAQQDPAGDFLARERAALGADAQSFAAPSDSDAFDKDYEKSAAAFPDLEGSGGADDDVLGDFAGGGNHAATSAVTTGQQVSVTGNDEFAAFEEEYPEIDLPSEQVRSIPCSPARRPGELDKPQADLTSPSLQPHENGLNGSSAPEPAPAAFSQPAAASTQSATAPQDSGDSEFIR